AIGSALAMNWLSVTAGLVGKSVTGQVPLWLSVAVVLGAIPGAQLGALVNRRISRDYLRYLFVALMAVIVVRMWLEVLNRLGVV
ncbi:TSUP family transporter, partial [Chloroflexota bacterium]